MLLRFPEDVLKIEELVKSEFEIDTDRSVPSSQLEDPFRFGYPAAVYILALTDTRSRLREWAKYKNLSFRLELRTLLQEAWATIFPRVNQTVGSLSEKKLTRELVLLSSLLEKGDDESLLGRWNAIAQEAGFPEFTPDADYLRESFTHLCSILRASDINTLSDVRKFLADMENDNKGLQQLRTIHDTFRDNNKWRVDPFSALFLLVLNFKWEDLKDKDLVKLNIKKGSDRISGND